MKLTYQKGRNYFFLILGFTGAIAYYFPHTLISPGNLHPEHEKKVSSCLDCHTLFSGVPDTSCYRCHNRQSLLSGSGKFMRFENQQPGAAQKDERISGAKKSTFRHPQEWIDKKNCLDCHGEHLPPGNPASAHLLRSNGNISFYHRPGADCASCHSIPGSHIPLPAGSRDNCGQCHVTTTWKKINPGAVGVFHNKNANCLNCHKKSMDNLHQKISGNCASCHRFDTWKTTFNHTPLFRLDKKHNKGCEKCHPANYDSYTCNKCHRQSKMERIHFKRDIRNFQKCADCHRSSSEKAAKEAWRKIVAENRDNTYR